MGVDRLKRKIPFARDGKAKPLFLASIRDDFSFVCAHTLGVTASLNAGWDIQGAGPGITCDAQDSAVLVTVAAGTEQKESIHLSSQKLGDTFITVNIGKAAEVMLFDETEVKEGARIHSINVVMEEGGKLEYISLVKGAGKISIVQNAQLGKDAQICWRNISLGADVSHALRSQALGSGATSTIDWIFYAKGQEKQKLSVRNVFNGKEGSGKITMKGVAEQKAHVVCNGLIEIGLDGGGTDTYLTQDVLMLDKTSKVDAIPGLEIKTNDVKASHSATISRVTEEDLFYFAARGIPAQEARGMYVQGFLGDLLSRISDLGTKEVLQGLITEKFNS